MEKNKNYKILDAILGPDGRHNPCTPNRGDEQDGSDFVLTLESEKLPFEERFRKFLPREREQ